jgi:hypothetical protein
MYERNLFSESFVTLPESDDGRRNLADFGEFVLRVKRYSDIEMMTEWPELYSPEIVRSDTIQMYKRAAAEARQVVGRLSWLDSGSDMRISHAELEACLKNPRGWYVSSRTASSHGYSMGYERALRLTLFHYHKTSADEARRYLEQMVKKHNFKNEARVSQIGLTWSRICLGQNRSG